LKAYYIECTAHSHDVFMIFAAG